MVRNVFFSFHYERDIWRANVVRNSWVTKDRISAGFWDRSLWEKAKKTSKEAVKRMIDDGLKNTSVTAVLIGAETIDREWVNYEIIKSYKRSNGILGVYIHQISDQTGNVDQQGKNPFSTIYIEQNGRRVYFTELYPTYYWYTDDGYKNFGEWVEKAAKKAGR